MPTNSSAHSIDQRFEALFGPGRGLRPHLARHCAEPNRPSGSGVERPGRWSSALPVGVARATGAYVLVHLPETIGLVILGWVGVALRHLP